MIPLWVHHFEKKEAGHSYTFWTAPIMIFSPVSNVGDQSLALYGQTNENSEKIRKTERKKMGDPWNQAILGNSLDSIDAWNGIKK